MVKKNLKKIEKLSL